jgi:hypothetical protein
MSYHPTLLWLCKEDLSAGWSISWDLFQSELKGTNWGSFLFLTCLERKKRQCLIIQSYLFSGLPLFTSQWPYLARLSVTMIFRTRTLDSSLLQRLRSVIVLSCCLVLGALIVLFPGGVCSQLIVVLALGLCLLPAWFSFLALGCLLSGAEQCQWGWSMGLH